MTVETNGRRFKIRVETFKAFLTRSTNKSLIRKKDELIHPPNYFLNNPDLYRFENCIKSNFSSDPKGLRSAAPMRGVAQLGSILVA